MAFKYSRRSTIRPRLGARFGANGLHFDSWRDSNESTQLVDPTRDLRRTAISSAANSDALSFYLRATDPNRLEAIDPALCRPGRFDYHIEVASPDEVGRLAILGVHLSKLKHSDFRLDDLVQETDGYSGAELAALCREAGLQAIQRGLAIGVPANRLVVRRQDMQAALNALQAKRVNLEAR